MRKNGPPDGFLAKRIRQYDAWLGQGGIAYSSRVVPVAESLDTGQAVLPTEQVMEIVRAADVVAVEPCECRTHYQRCSHPREVCLLFGPAARRCVSGGTARYIGVDEAEFLLREANRSGLVHLALYMPDHQVYALCSCCSCCCHDLQIVLGHGRRDLMVWSEYVAVTDMDACLGCGDCVERCIFGARAMEGGTLACDPAACAGCGLCVTSCPADATRMERRGK